MLRYLVFPSDRIHCNGFMPSQAHVFIRRFGSADKCPESVVTVAKSEALFWRCTSLLLGSDGSHEVEIRTTTSPWFSFCIFVTTFISSPSTAGPFRHCSYPSTITSFSSSCSASSTAVNPYSGRCGSMGGYGWHVSVFILLYMWQMLHATHCTQRAGSVCAYFDYV